MWFRIFLVSIVYAVIVTVNGADSMFRKDRACESGAGVCALYCPPGLEVDGDCYSAEEICCYPANMMTKYPFIHY